MANGAPTNLWPHLNHLPQITYLPPSNTWLCLVRRIQPPGEWTSLEPNSPGHPDPVAALTAASTRLESLLASRVESLAQETLFLLRSQRLRQIDDREGGATWEAKDDQGNWRGTTHPTPEEAARSVGRGEVKDGRELRERV